MTATPLQRAKAELGAMMVPITVDDFHLMMRAGILREGDPIELIDGLLVRKDQGDRGVEITHGPRHASTVRRLNRLLAPVKDLGGCHQIQLPVTLASTQEPEPDGAVMRGRETDFESRHPQAVDLATVIEVADS